MWGLDQSHRQSRANRAQGGDLPQFGSDGMLATLRQQFAPGLLAQGLQHIQLLIELLGAATGASLGDFPQPLAAMAGIVNVPAATGWDRGIGQSSSSPRVRKTSFRIGVGWKNTNKRPTVP